MYQRNFDLIPEPAGGCDELPNVRRYGKMLIDSSEKMHFANSLALILHELKEKNLLVFHYQCVNSQCLLQA